jgi:hypothetical protein
MKTFRISRYLVVLAAALPVCAYGWGETGHRVVCQIAFDELHDRARTEVERLLNLDPAFESFADSCLYADIPERIRMYDHFMNVPRSAAAITSDECPLAETCVVTAIPSDLSVLADPESRDAEKLLALKLLGHWVGDIHQPMHVAYQDDRGANNIDVDLDMPDANLHGVWDYSIVAANLGDDYTRIATALRASISDWQRVSWLGSSPAEWANESYQITIAPSAGYCVRKQGACWYNEESLVLREGGPRRQMAISDAYLKKHGPVIARRLQQAGLRLSELLNQAFD